MGHPEDYRARGVAGLWLAGARRSRHCRQDAGATVVDGKSRAVGGKSRAGMGITGGVGGVRFRIDGS